MSNSHEAPIMRLGAHPAPSAAHQAYDFAQVDVFAERPLEGNMLAVFTDARGLSTEEMQAIARETNLSETTFVLPRAPEVERERGVQVRIFTVREELNFAGHPTLGTASWLYLNHPVYAGAETITLDLRVGPITVAFPMQQQSALGVFGSMRQNDPEFGQVHDRAAVARAIGLSVEDLDPEMPIQTVSTGMAFCIVPLRSLEVARRLAIPQPLAQAYLAQTDAKFFHCITRAEASSGAQWHARMQFYNGEDPATGSASGCAIAYLVRHSLARSGEQIVIEQGVEMLRPSRIYASAVLDTDEVREVRVAGRTIPTAMGRFFLP
ncbi:MAG TPA: PhzF family phenazine biosynthesis protein [Acidobacteriaceae bacterium]|nr:PhzF family phenazine biosynthesis protein [Acidobacteriaceae bacterium]